jgi:hypothetical protein
MLGEDERIPLLHQRIRECKAWLEISSYQLRSAVLEPPMLGMQDDTHKYGWLTEPYGRAIVEGLASLRGALVHARNPYPLTETSLAKEGKLLLSAPHMGFLDGNTSAVTGGYIDIYDAPPWDTWLDVVDEVDIPDYYDTFLVAWVPMIMVSLVEVGIRTSPGRFLAWASDVNSKYTRQLDLTCW